MLDRLMDDLASREEISWTCLVGEDGTPIRIKPGVLSTPEAAAALAEQTISRAEEHLMGGQLTRMSLVGEEGTLVLVRVGPSHILISCGRDIRGHGTVRNTTTELGKRMASIIASGINQREDR
jgi:predicted regulator of Ras-like GTPase activity (Roadblock/LC7/MglB family)|tara:strand:- start:1005 stop:1373 length:369 start_codon:yes stop_codon:yes gene_type:complete